MINDNKITVPVGKSQSSEISLLFDLNHDYRYRCYNSQTKPYPALARSEAASNGQKRSPLASLGRYASEAGRLYLSHAR